MGWSTLYCLTIGCFATILRSSAIATTGCYTDCSIEEANHTAGCVGRILSTVVAVDDPTTTAEGCVKRCEALGFKLAGVEASHGCFCGNTFANNNTQRPISECCESCAGNRTQTCGAPYRILIITTSSSSTSVIDSQDRYCQRRGDSSDVRSIANGTVMITDGYLDQPYCYTYPKSGRWLCTITGSTGLEGSKGEHIMSIFSDDLGATWSAPVSVEPKPVNEELANAYSMTIVAPNVGVNNVDRAYAIYNMNLDNVTRFPGSSTELTRVDMMGVFCMRYSDDQGLTWSEKRYEVPYRLTSIDYINEWGGNVTIMWTVDTLKVRGGVVYFAFTKIGKYLLGPPEELFVMSSSNLLTARDPDEITWELLPEGDHGIKPVGGVEDSNIEEAHVLPLTTTGYPGLYVCGRTTVGWLVESHTTDKTGRSNWTDTKYAQYYDPRVSQDQFAPLNLSPSFGVPSAGLKNPRGPIQAKYLPSKGAFFGGWLLVFYNNAHISYAGDSRNPYWLSVGHEVSGSTVLWSQPEIVLYNNTDPIDRPGYPDFITNTDEQGNLQVWLTETQKTISRIHPIDTTMISELFAQADVDVYATGEIVLTEKWPTSGSQTIPLPPLPAFSDTPTWDVGVTLCLMIEDHSKSNVGEVILSSVINTKATTRRGATEEASTTTHGVEVSVGANRSLVFKFGDGNTESMLVTDPVCTMVLQRPGAHYWAVVADGGPRIVMMMVDGVLCDGGGPATPQGWAWFPPMPDAITGDDKLTLSAYGGKVDQLRLYSKRLSTSQLVGNYRAGCKEFGGCN
eukprot:m.101663 g.101663  ORF g.101663 m.101663 type:complete len:791 (+) comp27342_c0_seq1:36-2408(+)